MLLRVACAAFAGLVIAASCCSAKEVKIGSAVVVLSPPEGFCELTSEQPSDARVINILGDALAGLHLELQVMSANCSQLDPWRVGKRPVLEDFAEYQTSVPVADVDVSRAEAVKAVCAAIRSQADAVLAKLSEDIKARAKMVDIEFHGSSSLGVLAEDANACYYGQMHRFRTEPGDEKTQLSVSADTVVKGTLIHYHLYAVYHGEDDVPAALARQQRNLAALLAANGG